MNPWKIGLRLESLGLPLRRALQEAQRLGVRGVQADAVGELAPQTLSQTGRGALRHLLKSHGLELTALGCPLRQGLDSPDNQQQRISFIESALALSVDLGAGIAIVQAGRVPKNADGQRALILTEILKALAQRGDRIGGVLALETGEDSGATVNEFLDSLGTGVLGVNLDPANLLVNDFDPSASARALKDKIKHIRATDASRADAGRSTQQVQLGQGDVGWAQYLNVLAEIGYSGWLTVEREGGGNRVAEVGACLDYLKGLVKSAA